MNTLSMFVTFFIPALVVGCLLGGLFVYAVALEVIEKQREEIAGLKRRQALPKGKVVAFRKAS